MAKSLKKIPKTFISFLIISFFIWLLITFSKEYTTTITYTVNYKDIAQDKLLQETPLKEIDISIKATGFKIIRSKIRNKIIDLDASKLERKNTSRFYLLPKNQIQKIQNQLLSGIVINEIIQDTIYLNLGVLASKKVVLKPNLDINYHIGYDLLDKIIVSPDSVIISGPEEQIRNINHVDLSKLSLNNVKSDFTKEVTIEKSEELKRFKYNFSKATILGKVDKFTEGTLEIPFTVNNLPQNINLTTLNKDVEVVFVVALSNFAKVSESSFDVECDYEIAQKNNLGYLIPEVTKKPNYIKSFKIVPNKIDFLIQK